MLTMRLGQKIYIDTVFFAECGFVENMIGIFQMFSFKRQLVKIGKYSKKQQRSLIV